MDGKRQEGLRLVEDIENREGHKGFLGVHGVVLGHQRVDCKHNQRDLRDTSAAPMSCERGPGSWASDAASRGPCGRAHHVGMASLQPELTPNSANPQAAFLGPGAVQGTPDIHEG